MKISRTHDSLSCLHAQSVELILHSRRLQKEFVELREASKLLRLESMQLTADLKDLRLTNFQQFPEVP